MKLKLLTATIPLVTVLFFSSAWAQQTPEQSQPEASTTRAKEGQKEKHLSGSLVDMGCMAKTLGAETKAPSQPESAFGVPHLMGWGATSPQTGQVPPGGGPGTMQGPGQRTTDPGLPSDNQIPTSEDQRAQMAKVDRVENAARQCVASPLTQTLGLAMADGQVVQFDQDGCAKAREALKSADVQAGKKIKAKVVGSMEDKTTVNVASIEIKGKGKKSSTNTGT
jgi:hypothetical protein